MGFRFRKSINLGGGFGINLSKSGVGYSWGVPGYRVTKTAKGNTRKTYSIPGTGLGYIEETNNKRKTNQSNNSYQYIANDTVMHNIQSAVPDSFQPAEYQDFIKSVKRILMLNRISTWLMLTFIFSSKPIFLVSGALGLILKVFIWVTGKINLDYELDDYCLRKHQDMLEAWNQLNQSNKVWQVIQSGNVTNKKLNAGASTLIKRVPIKIRTSGPRYLRTDLDIIQLDLKNEILVFLPDKLLIINGLKVGAVSYDEIKLYIGNTRFIEEEKLPSDSTVIDYTWSKVTKDGLPDKRFKGNKQLPICNYGNIEIISNSGLNISIQCSSIDNTIKFSKLMDVK